MLRTALALLSLCFFASGATALPDSPQTGTTVEPGSKAEAAAAAKTEADCPMHKAGCRHHGERGAGHAHGAVKTEGGCPMHKESGAAMHGKGRGKGMQGHGMQGHGMRGQGMQGGDHATIHSLMADHEAISRKTEEVPGGVRTVTTSKDAEVAATIRQHAYEMKARLESGQPIRMFDPLFVEIFKHHDKIVMKIEEIEGGVRVTETSEDPKVAALIRQHAKVVDEFTAKGMERMHQTSPLPEGYAKP